MNARNFMPQDARKAARMAERAVRQETSAPGMPEPMQAVKPATPRGLIADQQPMAAEPAPLAGRALAQSMIDQKRAQREAERAARLQQRQGVVQGPVRGLFRP